MVCMFLFHSHLLLLKSEAFKESKEQFKQKVNKRELNEFF